MAGEIKAYLSIHNVNIEDIMDDSTKSVTAIVLGNIHAVCTSEDTRRFNGKFQVAPQEDEDNYEEYMELTMEIRKKKDDIVNFSQILNYVLSHSTKPGDEKCWRQLQLHFAGGHRAQQFSFLRAIMQGSWNSYTRQSQSSTTIGWKISIATSLRKDQSGSDIRRGASMDFQ
eukprot:4121892-Amphidinium_carterae.1